MTDFGSFWVKAAPISYAAIARTGNIAIAIAML
jgi:hypothetical protein